jgi:hypothetical protein
MPLMDAILIFSDEQAFVGAGSAASTNVIDFGETNPNLGDGTPLIVNFIINETFTTCDSVAITLQDGATSTPATDLITSAAVLTASLTKGAYLREIMIPSRHLRYMRLYYTIAGSNPGAGKITAYIGTPK